LIAGGKTVAQVTSDICAPLQRRAGGWWQLAFLAAVSVLLLGVAAVSYQLEVGIGTWGLNRSVGWAFDITNFVFWIGIGHAGTLISAILFLFRQKWRTSVNRSAEAMTLFAVMCAGIFPVIHMGRAWLFYWIIPYPNMRGLWDNFRSPLFWDFCAIGTYFLISLVFWYVGLVPDLATLRDRVGPGWYRRFVGFLSLGWDGSHRTWRRYEVVYLLLAGLATPLVVSVHSVVSTDFAAALLPGWHSTIFPPYFVAGAIFSGMAMVLTLMLVVRKVLHLEDYLTPRHIDAMAKLVLATSCLVGLAYAIEFFTAFYEGNPYESFAFANRALGPLGWGFAVMVVCNVLMPQLLWFPAVRRRLLLVFAISVLVNVGMWMERFVIIVGPLERDFLPAAWAGYAPTLIEIATLLGSFGLFFSCFLAFCRLMPVIAMAEVKGVLAAKRDQGGEDAAPAVAWSGPAAATGQAPVPAESNEGTPSAAPAVVLAGFATGEELLEAVRAVKKSEWQIVDVYTPYPVHGLEEALGWRRSRLPAACLLGGAAGAALALWFQFWASAQDWPINVGGRPWNSLPAFVPVAFESMVLLAGFGLVAAWLLRCGLYPGKKARPPLAGVTDDRFALAVRNPGTPDGLIQLRRLLHECHALTVEGMGGGGTAVMKRIGWVNPALFVLLLGGVALYFAVPPRDVGAPNYEFLPEAQMAQSPAYDSFAPNPRFADGLTLRTPPPGTVVRGSTPLHYLPTLEDAVRAGDELKNPFRPGDAARRERGAAVFANYCQVCHGPLGQGNGPVTQGGFPPPASLLADRAVRMKDGQMFHVLAYGQGNMASFAAQLSEDDRWSVILHVRVLQGPYAPGPEETRTQAVAKLFNETCAACHGPDGKGGPVRKILPLIPDFSSMAWQMSQTEVAIVNQINYGSAPMMPAFRYKLTPGEVASLAVYVRSLGGRQPGAPAGPTPPSHLTAESIYGSSCFACHELNGKGNLFIKQNPAAKDLPDFTDPAWQKSRTDADLAKSILEGTGKGKLMVSRKDELGSVDVKDMVALVRRFEGGKYVATLEAPKPGGPVLPPVPFPEAGPTALPARDVASLGGLLGSPSGYGPLFAASGLAPGRDVAAGPAPPVPTGLSEEEAERVRVGMTIFRGYCIVCHGPDGTGSVMRRSMPPIPDFTSEAFQKTHSDAQLRASILNGKGTLMPANAGRVTVDQARDLAAYVRTFGPWVPPAAGGSDAEFAEEVRRLEQQMEQLHKQMRDINRGP
jgi:molybdopterin-containing oxidoreductase family membrane subunit